MRCDERRYNFQVERGKLVALPKSGCKLTKTVVRCTHGFLTLAKRQRLPLPGGGETTQMTTTSTTTTTTLDETQAYALSRPPLQLST